MSTRILGMEGADVEVEINPVKGIVHVRRSTPTSSFELSGTVFCCSQAKKQGLTKLIAKFALISTED